MDLARIATVGSVDDGKSTLIGRLLYDSKAVFEDGLDSVTRISQRRQSDYLELALLTDGLRAEREQGITIDVAYRYFNTPKRNFIIADTPGHLQYTRNMVTGASTADVVLVIVDARNGIVEQSRRHAIIASLLGIKHAVVCVNKMDLVDFNPDVFDSIRDEFEIALEWLGVEDVRFVPVSALNGDNVINRSENMSWYEGLTLLEQLESMEVKPIEIAAAPRFPVQYVIRPQLRDYADYRGYAGTVASGTFSVGDRVVVLPGGQETGIVAIDTPSGPTEKIACAEAATLRFVDQIGAARGDLVAPVYDRPQVSDRIDASICWMSESSSLKEGSMLRLKQTSRTTRALISSINTKTDVTTLDIDHDIDELKLNEIGTVSLQTMDRLVFDNYSQNRVTGSFILIDEITNDTVAAGMIRITG